MRKKTKNFTLFCVCSSPFQPGGYKSSGEDGRWRPQYNSHSSRGSRDVAPEGRRRMHEFLTMALDVLGPSICGSWRQTTKYSARPLTGNILSLLVIACVRSAKFFVFNAALKKKTTQTQTLKLIERYLKKLK